MKKLSFPFIAAMLFLITWLSFVGGQAQTTAAPTNLAVNPTTGFADQQTSITVTGQGFVITSTVHLDETPLLEVTFIDSSTLAAVVPFGLSPGVYSLTVSNPLTGVLTNAFTVTAGVQNWVSGGPYGGGTHDIKIHPTMTDTVYVVVGLSGLYRTTDGGQHWEQVFYSSRQPLGSVAVWPANPDVVFFSGDDGLYRSASGGDVGSWQLVNIDPQINTPPSDFAISPSNPQIMYCALNGQVYYSNDGGGTWAARSTGLPGEPWLLAISQQDAATVYATLPDGTLYKTSNAGQVWEKLPPSFPIQEDGEGGITVIATDPYRPNNVWIGTWMQGLHRSTDGGQTFNEVAAIHTVGFSSGFWAITFDPNQDRVFVGVSGPHDALYYSDDTGDSWTGLGLNNQGGRDIAVPLGNSEIIYTTWAGVRKSMDEGKTWEWLAEGMAGIQPKHIAVSPHDPQRVLAMAESDGAHGTHNSGNSWVTYPISQGGESHQHLAAAFDTISPAVAYVGGTETVFKTSDDGRHWQATAPMPVDGLPATHERVRPLFLAVHPHTNTIVYAGTSFFNVGSETINAGALYRSDDAGGSWTRVTTVSTTSSINRVLFAPTNPDIMYLGTGAGCHWCLGTGIWRSTDGGQTWEQPQSDLISTSVIALAIHPEQPETLLAGAWSGANSGIGIFRSTDGGDSWQQATGLDDNTAGNITDIVYDPLDPRVVYAASYAGLRISFDGGLSWHVYPGAMGQLPITALTSAQDGTATLLYIGTVGGTTVVQPASSFHVNQSSEVLGAGVYLGQTSQWHFLFLPLSILE